MHIINVIEKWTNREIFQQIEQTKAHKYFLEERHQRVHLWAKENIITLHPLLII